MNCPSCPRRMRTEGLKAFASERRGVVVFYSCPNCGQESFGEQIVFRHVHRIDLAADPRQSKPRAHPDAPPSQGEEAVPVPSHGAGTVGRWFRRLAS